jgi:carbonic anhydrase
MSLRDECLRANAQYAAFFPHKRIPRSPAKRLAVVTCMDARIQPDDLLGLAAGDAHIIRNAGGIVTDDALRSLVLSHKLRGTREFFVINHTDCGLQNLDEAGFRDQLRSEGGPSAVEMPLYAYHDIDENVRAQVERIKTSPYIAGDSPVSGFVYDVESGQLRPVVGA